MTVIYHMICCVYIHFPAVFIGGMISETSCRHHFNKAQWILFSNNCVDYSYLYAQENYFVTRAYAHDLTLL